MLRPRTARSSAPCSSASPSPIVGAPLDIEEPEDHDPEFCGLGGLADPAQVTFVSGSTVKVEINTTAALGAEFLTGACSLPLFGTHQR